MRAGDCMHARVRLHACAREIACMRAGDCMHARGRCHLRCEGDDDAVAALVREVAALEGALGEAAKVGGAGDGGDERVRAG